MASTNKTVLNALKVANEYQFKDMGGRVIRTGDTVEYDGKVYTAKALGSPSMDSATIVDDAGNKLVVKMKDYKLKALNEDTSVVTEKAVNAKDAEGTVIKVGDTVILADEGDYDNPKEFKVKSISGSYIHLDDGHHEYEKDLLVYNSRACNLTNAIVRKAMDYGINAAAKNATDWEKVYQIKGMPVKLVWRGEPFNDLKATVEGGNRTYVPVARIIASNPVSQTEAEKLCAAKWRQIKATANAVKTTNAVVAKALNSVRNSVYQTETELERAIGAKLGKSVDVGIDGNAVSISLESKGDIEKAVAAVKEKLGDVVSYKYMDGSDPWLQVTLKTSVPNAATKDAVAREALNYSPYHKGGWLHDHKSGRNFTVVKEEHWGKDSREKDSSPVECRCVTLRDSTTGRIVELPTTLVDYRFHFGEVEACDVCNSSSVRTRNAVVQKALNAIGGVGRNNTITDPQRLDFAKSRVKYVASGEKYGGQGRTVDYFIDIKVPINKKEMAALDKEIKDFETESTDYRSLIKMEPDNKDVYEKASVAAKKIADGDRELLASLRKGQTIESDGRFKLVYNPFNEGWAFYVGGNGESMRDMIGRPIVGASRKADAVATFERLVASANRAVGTKALNAEDAQGHKHGADGKFISKGGDSSDGGYEDPKTKRMKERLARMREKNEALRKDIEARKAGIAQKKTDIEKMRAEVMKANVDKWKAMHKSKNAVVQKALNTVAANAWMPLGSTPVSSAKDADGRSIRVGDIVTKTSGSWTEDTVAAIFKEIDGNIAITLKGSPRVVRDPAVEIVKNANSNHNTSKTQGYEMASTNKAIRNAVAAYNYTMIGGRTKPVTRTDGDIEGELMLGWTEIKRRVNFGDESSEREYGQKLKDLFEGKRLAFVDRANARRLEDALLREWNKLAEFNKLSSL